jgi:hypothetical protein
MPTLVLTAVYDINTGENQSMTEKESWNRNSYVVPIRENGSISIQRNKQSIYFSL